MVSEKTAAQKKAQQKYMEKFAVARVRMDRDKYEHIQSHAESRGQSVNGFINRAIQETIERDTGAVEGPQEALQAQSGVGDGILFPGTLKAAQEAAEAAGEGLPQFLDRAVVTQAQRDALARKMEGGGQGGN